MKTTILILSMITLLSMYAIAQDTYVMAENKTDFRNDIQLGVKMGINISNVYDTKGEQFKANPKVGLATGLFLSIPIGTFIGLQPEILFSQKGFKATGSLFDAPYDLTLTKNYIDIPLLVSIKPIDNFTILAGPQYSYLLSQKYKFENASTTILQEEEFMNESYRKNTICFTGGFDINVDHLVVGGRIGWDLFNNNGDGTSTTPRYRDVWYQITLGYRMYK
ncbi:MAG: PorT family protein [Bacteroidales bacterium]|nr:PorT family protein [Bacteroidales bacterium]MCF8455696.1 PorT family protein [Bacteroidales bacterium]